MRSLLRGLSIIEVLNARNGASLSDIVAATGLNRGTAYRMLETLLGSGYLRRDPRGRGYWLTPKVRGLSDGYHDESWIWEIAEPRMEALGREIVWPLSLTTALGIDIVIRATTDRLSPLTFVHVSLGSRLPMVGSAAGRAHLAFTNATQRGLLLELIRKSSEDPRDRPAHHPAEIAKILTKVQKDGYALFGGDTRYSTCAVPIFSQRRNIASLVMRFPTIALKPSELVRRYLGALTQCARDIGQAFDSYTPSARR